MDRQIIGRAGAAPPAPDQPSLIDRIVAVMRWTYPRILAHRGGGTLAPENTLAAIRAGRAAGFEGIECDAMLSADRVPMLIHDPTLERTTEGRGDVAAATAAELGRLDAGSWLAPRFAGEPVPTLAQAIALCRELGSWMNVEIKPSPGRDIETGVAVADLVARSFGPGETAPLLSSFSRSALAAARRAQPRLALGWLCEAPPAHWRAALDELGAVALHCDHRRLTAERALEVKAAGYGLFCYTVDDPARVTELFDWGVDALCTDRLDRVLPNVG